MAAYNFPNSPSDGDTVTSNGITYTYSSSKTRWDGAAASGSSTTVYATIDLLPLSGASTGDQAYVSGNNRLYIWNGTGWYNIALINTTPSISGASSAYALATDGTATTVTITATDPEGIPITYSIASDTSGNVATVTQGTGANSNVFTVTPSTNTANAGTFSLTFRASDGVNIATAVSSFTLVFSVENSNYTTALITSVGANNAVNNSFDDASTNNYTITANGNVTQGSFSPYRHGGYSSFYQATIAEYHSSTTPALGSSGWTIEGWFYRTGGAGSGIQVAGHIGAINSSTGCAWGFNGGSALIFRGAGTTDSSFSISDATNTWAHIAFVYDGTDLECFVNGSSVGTATRSLNITDTSVTVGYGNTNFSYEGYITDFRLSSTARSISAAPDERLTADTNTEFLLDHRTLTDSSSNSASVSTTGTIDQDPWSPFDHNGYSSGSNGGSMYFDGSGDYLVTGADADQFINSGNTGTIEMWLRLDAFSSPRTSLCGQWTSTGGYAGWTFDLDTSGQLQIGVNGNVNSAKTTGLTLGRWHHFAVVNTGSAINIFTDGIYKSTSTNASATSASSSSLTVGSRSDNSLPTNGIIADFRFVDGTVVYDRGSASIGDKVFTPPTAPLTAITNTSLLLNGTDAGIIDKSQSVKTITLNGNVKSSTTQTKYLNSSMYFDGTGDSITIGDNQGLHIGSGDFTIEMWFRAAAVNTNQTLMLRRSAVGARGLVMNINSSAANKLGFVAGDSNTGAWEVSFNSTSDLSANTWHHVAIVRSGNNFYLYLDGTREATASSSATIADDTSDLLIGTNEAGTGDFSGYISDLRITKGLARYTASDETANIPSAALQG